MTTKKTEKLDVTATPADVAAETPTETVHPKNSTLAALHEDGTAVNPGVEGDLDPEDGKIRWTEKKTADGIEVTGIYHGNASTATADTAAKAKAALRKHILG